MRWCESTRSQATDVFHMKNDVHIESVARGGGDVPEERSASNLEISGIDNLALGKRVSDNALGGLVSITILPLLGIYGGNGILVLPLSDSLNGNTWSSVLGEILTKQIAVVRIGVRPGNTATGKVLASVLDGNSSRNYPSADSGVARTRTVNNVGAGIRQTSHAGSLHTGGGGGYPDSASTGESGARVQDARAIIGDTGRKSQETVTGGTDGDGKPEGTVGLLGHPRGKFWDASAHGSR